MSSRAGVWCATEFDMFDIRASGRDWLLTATVKLLEPFLQCCMTCKCQAGNCSETYEECILCHIFSSSSASIPNGHTRVRAMTLDLLIVWMVRIFLTSEEILLPDVD